MVFPFSCKILKTANYIDSFDFTDFVSWEKHVIDSALCDFIIVYPPDTWLCSVSKDRAG